MDMYSEYLEQLLRGVKNYSIAEEGVTPQTIRDIVFEFDNLIHIGYLVGDGENHFFDKTKIPVDLEMYFTDFFLENGEIETIISEQYSLDTKEIPEYIFDPSDIVGLERIDDDHYVMELVEDLTGETVGYDELKVGTYTEEQEHLLELDTQYSMSKEERLTTRKPVALIMLISDYVASLEIHEFDVSREHFNLREAVKGYIALKKQENAFRIPIDLQERVVTYIGTLEISKTYSSFPTLELDDIFIDTDLEMVNADLLEESPDLENGSFEYDMYYTEDGQEVPVSELINLKENEDYEIDGEVIYFLTTENQNELVEGYYDEQGNYYTIEELEEMQSNGYEYTLEDDIVYFTTQEDGTDEGSEEAGELQILLDVEGNVVDPVELNLLEEGVDYEWYDTYIRFLTDDEEAVYEEEEQENVYYDENGNEFSQSDLEHLQIGIDYIVDGTEIEFLTDSTVQEEGESNLVDTYAVYYDEEGVSYTSEDLVGKTEGEDYILDGDIIEFLTDSEGYSSSESTSKDTPNSLGAVGNTDKGYKGSLGDSNYPVNGKKGVSEDNFNPFGASSDTDLFEPVTSYDNSMEKVGHTQERLDDALEHQGFNFGEMSGGLGQLDSSTNFNASSSNFGQMGSSFGSPFGTTPNGDSAESHKYKANNKFANLLMKFSDAILKTPNTLVKVAKKPYSFLIVDDDND